jgi:hypothetical protein
VVVSFRNPNPPPPTEDFFYWEVIGTETDLVVVLEPTNVNFGGDFQGGVYVIEVDKKSPPKPDTFTPSVGSLYATSSHDPTNAYAKINAGIAGFVDQLQTYRRKPSPGLNPTTHTGQWTCEFQWRDATGAHAYNMLSGKSKATPKGGVIFATDILQKFKIQVVSGTGAGQIQNAEISKFNSKVNRNTGGDSTRDIENNWKP